MNYLCAAKPLMTVQLRLTYAFWKARINLAFFISHQLGAKQAFQLFTTPLRKEAYPKPKEFDAARRFILEVGETKLVGYEWNPSSAKKILILHGFESRSFKFYMYVQPLLQLGYGIVAMDAKAHGESEGSTILINEYAEMIHVLEKKMGTFYACIAHSFGGIALCWYRELNIQPECRLILIAPGTETTTALDIFCSRLSLTQQEKTSLIRYLEQRGGKPLNYYSITRIAKKISNNIFWIHDQDDSITPIADVEPLISAPLNNVEIRITKGLGHNRIYREKSTVEAVISFLEK